jgi:hypothetical protein
VMATSASAGSVASFLGNVCISPLIEPLER